MPWVLSAIFDRLLSLILDAAARLIHADRSSVFIVDPDTGELLTRVAQGSETIRLAARQGHCRNGR